MSNIWNYIRDGVLSAYHNAGAYLSALSQHKVLAILLFMILILLLLLLVLFWYVRTVILSVQENRRKEQEIMDSIDPRLDRKVISLSDDDYISVPDDDESVESLSEQKRPKKQKNNVRKNAPDFDWDRSVSVKNTGDENLYDAFEYRLKPQKLRNLLGLIVDLLERGVDEPKIAQTIMFKNQHLNNEDDIIQAVTAVKFFIYLCINNRFKKLTSEKMLPQESTAIFHIARGDCSLAMVLLETLIDNQISKTKSMKEGREKERRWSEISNCATILGTLASFEDKNLATGAFELAIELNPRNVTAWGRIGDMYVQQEQSEKAVWAYSNVLNLADEAIYTQQIANAGKMLAVYYNENNRRADAEQLQKRSQKFYNAMGIDVPLTEREIKIVQIIESKEFDNMENIVDNLFDPQAAIAADDDI